MAPKKDYTPEQMGRALDAVRKGEKIGAAALRFGVPRITLYNKVSGKSPAVCSMGPQTILTTDEEQILVKWLLGMSERHFPVTRVLLTESVQRIITEQGKANPFTDNKPGKKWFTSFLKRHPEITEKTAQNLSKSRDDVKEEDIRRWFEEIDTYLQEKGLSEVLNDPSRIFNTDESAFFLSPKAGRVLCKQGEKHLYQFCGDEKDNLTVLITANAAGQLAPPMIVFKYERVPAHISATVPDNWGIGKSESGWMCGSTFYEFITNVFNPWLEQQDIQKPVLFFLDGHKSHLTLHLSNFCSANGIEVIALYPNSTHILQPMDLAVFRPLKVAWKKEVSKWQMDHLGQVMKKEHFAPVLKNAIDSISDECIRNGFRAGGLHPFGPDYIDMTKIKKHQVDKEVDPKQIEFVKYLEDEIVKVYSRQKLKMFNTLYHKDRNTVEQTIPSEDESLFVIWAKNKQESFGSETSMVRQIETTEAQPSTSGIPNSETSDTERQEVGNLNESFGFQLEEHTAPSSQSDGEVQQDENSTAISTMEDFQIQQTVNRNNCYAESEEGGTEPESTNQHNISLNVSSETRATVDVVIHSGPGTESIKQLTPSSKLANCNVSEVISSETRTLVDVVNHSGPGTESINQRTPSKLVNGNIRQVISSETRAPVDVVNHGGPETESINQRTPSKSANGNISKVIFSETPTPVDLVNQALEFNDTTNNSKLPDSLEESTNDHANDIAENVPSKTNRTEILNPTPLAPERVPETSTGYNDSSFTLQTETPQKHPLETALGVVVPSPFKKSLFWPEEPQEKKRRKKEKIPFAITSKAWQEYHKKKEIEKQKLQEEKEKRAKEREEKKILKEKNMGKKKPNSKPKSKTNNHEDTTSDDTDTDVIYADSDDMKQKLQEKEKKAKQTRGKKILKEKDMVMKKPNSKSTIKSYNHKDTTSGDTVTDLIYAESDDSTKNEDQNESTGVRSGSKRLRKNQKLHKNCSDSDDEPLSKIRVFSKNTPGIISKGQFVIVKYEGEYFPGKTEDVDGNQYEVSTMILSTGNSFRWPEKPDKIWYKIEDVIQVINPPLPLNNRGFFKVKEMEKYLPNIYNI